MRAGSLDLHRICRLDKGLVRGAYLQSHSSLTPPRCARLRGQRSTRNLKGSIFIRLQMRRKGIKPTGLPCQTLSSVLLASPGKAFFIRSEEHTSELQSLMRISYAVFCLKKKNNHNSIYIITK